MSVLSVQNLTKIFGPAKKPFVAVDNISFSLGEGEILGLLGPNGAGKTTTIQMLLGVLTPTSGQISYFGKNFAENREDILEKVNFSSTYTNLPWNLSVEENLTFISYLYDIPDRKKQLNNIIDIFRLEKLKKSILSELSAGQLTRVNLAKAFINDPSILLLDEPTASLDPEVAHFIRDFILSERSKKKISIIFTSHNMSEVEEICDRILFINNGKIVSDDTPRNLMKTMENAKVHLIIPKENAKVVTNYSLKNKVRVYGQETEFIIEIMERNVPHLLTYLYDNNVQIYEIAIDKPNLEDYFLKIASKNKNRDL